MHRLVDHTTRFLQTHSLEGPYLLAVSGGRDSSALLRVFHILFPAQIFVAHFDHRVRASSGGDAQFVQEEASGLGIPILLGEGSGLRADEETLRQERWAFLESARETTGARWIVTAHHAEDQWETAVSRLLRGTGVTGLAGMAPMRGVRLRPWLGIAPTQIADFIEVHSIPFREDPSNSNVRYLRNSLRAELRAPMRRLSEQFGGYEAFLERFAILAEELSSAAARSESENLREVFPDLVHTPFFDRCVATDRKRNTASALRAWARTHDIALLRDQAERAADFFHSKAGSRFDAGAGVRLERSIGQLYLQTSVQRESLLRWRAEVIFLAAQCRSRGALTLPEPCGGSVQWDTESGAELRFLRPGDRYRGRRITRWLRERNVAVPERSLLLALTRDDDVLWTEPLGGEMKPNFRVDFPFSFQ